MTHPETSPKPSHRRYFFEKFGLTERLLERCLGEALSAGGDYADLYFESVTATALGVDEQIVKSASQGTSAGCGIRVLSGERTGYAYTDNLSPERLLHAARTAALIASGPAKAAGAGVHRDARRGFVSGSAGRLRPGPGGAAGTDSSRRSRGARLRCAHRAGAGELRRGAAADSDCRIRRRLCQRHAAAVPAERVCDRQRRRGDDQGLGGRRRTRRTGAIHRDRKARRTWRARRREARFCNWAPCPRRPARCKWCWVRAGRGFCCTKRWGTDWKPTSTARRPRRSRD